MAYTLRPLFQDGTAFKIYSLVIDGACKTQDFLEEVEHADADEHASTLAFLERCANHGPPKNKEKSRHVGDGIFEAKTKSTRICYFYDAGKMIVCTHGFYKPQERVQNAEIKTAKKTLEEYNKAKAKALIKIEKQEP